MPLPALLLERLKRRRIIKTPDETNQTQASRTQHDENKNDRHDGHPTVSTVVSRYENPEHEPETFHEGEEEIIAEDYSDENDEAGDSDSSENTTHTQDDRLVEESQISKNTDNSDAHKGGANIAPEPLHESVMGCPNKYNVYHECSQYCLDNYSESESIGPTLEQRKHLAIILKHYPMSNEWTIVYDPGVRTFYFWNILSDFVSWFPPGMGGPIDMSANEIRRSYREANMFVP